MPVTEVPPLVPLPPCTTQVDLPGLLEQQHSCADVSVLALMHSDIPSDITQIIAISVQGALYVPYTWTFGLCLHRFLRCSSGWKRFRDIDRTLLPLACILWLITTANFALGARRLAQEVLYRADGVHFGEGTISLVKVLLSPPRLETEVAPSY